MSKNEKTNSYNLTEEDAMRAADKYMAEYPASINEWETDFFVSGAAFFARCLLGQEPNYWPTASSSTNAPQLEKTIEAIDDHIRLMRAKGEITMEQMIVALKVISDNYWLKTNEPSQSSDDELADSSIKEDLDSTESSTATTDSHSEGETAISTERLSDLEATEKVYFMNREWIADAKQRIQDLENKLKTERIIVEEATRHRDGLHDALKDRNQKIQDTETENERLKERQVVLESELRDLKKENEQLKLSLSEKKS